MSRRKRSTCTGAGISKDAGAETPTKEKAIAGEVTKESIQKEFNAQPYKRKDLIPTGSTMYNLACSDYATGGWRKGSIVTVPGESDAGKTVLAMSALASCAADKSLKDYIIIMNNPESKGSFDLKQMFPPLVKRLQEPPGGNSQSIQQFGGSITTLCKKGQPSFIMVLDSLDFLKGDADHEKSLKFALKAAAGNKTAIKDIQKTFGMEKAKVIKKVLGEVNDQIKDTGSVLIIVQQLIANTDKQNKYDDPYRTNGGKTPFSSSTHSSRILHGPPITKTTENGQKLQVGHWARISCKKNHLTGKKRDVQFPIYEEYGIDDIESICDFLAKNYWEMSAKDIGPGTKIITCEFGDNINYYDLVDDIWNDNKMYTELKQIVETVWQNREASLYTGRKRIF